MICAFESAVVLVFVCSLCFVVWCFRLSDKKSAIFGADGMLSAVPLLAAVELLPDKCACIPCGYAKHGKRVLCLCGPFAAFAGTFMAVTLLNERCADFIVHCLDFVSQCAEL